MHSNIATAPLVLAIPALALTLLACPGPEPNVPEPALSEPPPQEAGPCDDPGDPNCPPRCTDVFPNPDGPVPAPETRCAQKD